MHSHDQDVEHIARDVRARRARAATGGSPVRIDKGGVSHFVPVPGDPRRRASRIDIASLNRILEIDPAARRCVAEPGVTFAELLRRTLPLGLMPTVVPELEGITVGGAVAGCSVESSSHRHGGFHDGCLEYEILTGEGDLLTCSPDRDPLVFEMIHGSYGTLGILTRLAFRLVPAAPYVRMEYRHFNRFEPFRDDLLAHCRAGDADFIDAIVHAPDAFVVCLGRAAPTAPYVSSYRWLDIYYRSTRARTEDYLTTYDYCFRYDTECHWMTRAVPLLSTRPARLVAGKLVLGSTNLIRWSHRLERLLGRKRRPDIVCDVFIPSRRLDEFHAWHAARLDYYPLWIVPYRAPKPYPWIAPALAARMQDDLMIDCAIYGMPNGDPDVDLSEALERRVFELGGLKALISRNHYSEERFWEIYDRERYEAVKRRLDPAGVFGDLYRKVHRVR
ncbi:MAG: FAD-binding oxidoreductase [Polyangiaceae bacterium]|nr:FAD-binding oxidoreductase [Polyangiaceae bacterium]